MDKAQDVDEEDGEASGIDCETITLLLRSFVGYKPPMMGTAEAYNIKQRWGMRKSIGVDCDSHVSFRDRALYKRNFHGGRGTRGTTYALDGGAAG